MCGLCHIPSFYMVQSNHRSSFFSATFSHRRRIFSVLPPLLLLPLRRLSRSPCRPQPTPPLHHPPPSPMSSPHALLSIVAAASTWHQRLGHPGLAVLHKLQRSSSIVCNTTKSKLCHTCQLGKHTRLPFASSTTSTSHCFELVHCDVWTSPVISNSNHKYYLLILDDFLITVGSFL
jgi:hypothetical protein